MNRLAGEASPYLRQHRDNPVDWYPWGSDAFSAAAQRDVPVLLSVGYSACHWCHVMAHESFEDDDVAAAMNTAFVNVKVDREERPDVDSIYMDAVQAMTGRGGWPMTVFLTPRGEPFYGGTYYPKATFLQLIEAVSSAWRDRRGELVSNVTALREALARSTRFTPDVDVPGESLIPAAVESIVGTFDPEWGGFGAAPKFPSTMALDLILSEVVHLGVDRRAHSALPRCCLDVARCDGVGRHLRPPRRRLRPLFGGRAMARAALREDALRPSAVRSPVRPRRGGDELPQVAPGRRRDRRVRGPRPTAAGRWTLLG